MARVVALHPSGADDRIRTVSVQFFDGDPGSVRTEPRRQPTPGTVRRTSANNLYRLEAYAESNKFEAFMKKPEAKSNPTLKNKKPGRKQNGI